MVRLRLFPSCGGMGRSCELIAIINAGILIQQISFVSNTRSDSFKRTM
jgi:hypothetical protein